MKMPFFVLISALIFCLAISACKKDIPPTPLTEFYATVFVDADSTTYLNEPSGVNTISLNVDKDSVALGSGQCAVNYRVQFRVLGGSTNRGFYFNFNRFFIGNCAEEPAKFRESFILGEHNFSANENDRGIILWYVDESGKLFDTEGDQFGSKFTIEISEKMPDDTGRNFSKHRLMGSFNCKVYDSSNQTHTLTKGKFEVYVISYDW